MESVDKSKKLKGLNTDRVGDGMHRHAIKSVLGRGGGINGLRHPVRFVNHQTDVELRT